MPKKQRLGRPRTKPQPAKKTARVTRQAVSAQEPKKSFLNSRWTESYTSLLMGIVVVIVSVLFIVSFIKQTHHVQDTSSIATAITPEVTNQPTELLPATDNNQKTYTVQAGDDLWKIAEKFYNSGYNWVDIAKANNLADPGTIHSGNTLIIPKVTPQVATVTATPAPVAATAVKTNSVNSINGNTYTVQAGDDLWNIALRAYGDGYRWVDIAKANNLDNPSLIFSGNVLKIPR